MSHIFGRIRSILSRTSSVARKLTKITPPQSGFNGIPIAHPTRFNAYKVAGYSFGALTTFIIAPIVLWPIADVWLLPHVISSTLSKSPSTTFVDKFKSIWGREYEISQIEYMLESIPNNIWILNGDTNCGKTALINKLLSSRKGIIYIDLRHFFDGNAFIFETIDALYDSNHNNSVITQIVGCYVKLFCFVTTIVAKTDQNVTAMMYFHAILNHLKAGLTKFNQRNPEQHPLVIFDHFEALPMALEKTTERLSHVLFVGNEYHSDLQHCDYWNLDGINRDIATQHIVQDFRERLDIREDREKELQSMARLLLDATGTNPHDISCAIRSVMSTIPVTLSSSDRMESLRENIEKYAVRCKGKAVGTQPGDCVLEQFKSIVSRNGDNMMEWGEALGYFGNDQDLINRFVDDGVLTKRRGKVLASNVNELMEMKVLGRDDGIYVGKSTDCCPTLPL